MKFEMICLMHKLIKLMNLVYGYPVLCYYAPLYWYIKIDHINIYIYIQKYEIVYFKNMI